MAVPAAARRSESLYANLDAGPNTPASPRRSSHHSPARTPTPRPSISPLSVASKAARGSPIATRDAIMRDSELEEEAAEAHHAADAEAEIGDVPDDRSSSLSEPEDLDEDEDTLAFVANGAKSTLPLPAQKTLDVDSEAETERLDDSPQKRRQHADSVGRTPSKLSKAAGVEDDLSEPPSPLPTGPGAASRQKRKRSDAEDSPLTSEESDVEQSPRKRSHALDANPLEGEIAQTTETNGIEEVQENEEVEIEQQIIEAPAAIPAKGIKGKRGRKPGRKPKSQEEAQELDVSEFAVDNEEEEPSAEIAPKSEEELKQKGEASSSFEQLAKQFAAFRQRLVNESLASAEHELALLNQADCVHPEYLRQVSCIDERKAKQEREANAYYRYRIQAVRERTLGERAQLHSQYFQTARELRENMLYALGEDWYGIQKERRQQHQEGEERYLYKLPSKKSAQIRQQAKYNQEVSVLSGIAKYVGFPAAPNISGVEGHGLEDDFKAMRIPRRMHQPVQHVHAHQQQHTHPSQQQQQHHQIQQQQAQIQQQQQQHQQAVYTQPPNVPPAAPSERQAHEQFLEQNAWARPQPSTVTAHVTPNFTHTPDWVDQPANPRHIMRNLTGPGQRTGSPFATPVSGKRAAGFMGDGPDVASSGLAAPPTISRTPGQGFSTGSPLQVGKQRQQNGNTGHNGERELTGFRNISNISSTSTIDAPLSAEKAQQEADRTPHYEGSLLARYLPALHSEGSAPHQAFDTSQLHRHPNAEEGGPGKDVYANPSFRPTEGAYGTPQASLMSGRTVPPGGQM